MNRQTLNTFFIGQLIEWPEAAARYRQLQQIQEKFLREGRKKKYRVIYNPLRTISVTANTTPKEPAKCPLCIENRPPEQNKLNFDNRYSILLNPYPIFSRHLTIVSNEHGPQQINGRMTDMLRMAQMIEGYTIFYNGPGAGASVPGHMHFQAASAEELPLNYKRKATKSEKIIRHRNTELRLVTSPASFLLTSTDINDAMYIFDIFYSVLDEKEKEMNNILVWYQDNKWYISIYIRRKHRPDMYYSDFPDKLTVSPAAAEMEGLIVTINPEDYVKIDKALWEQILEEVNITPERAKEIARKIKSMNKSYDVQVGILEAPSIDFNILSPYLLNGEQITGPQTVNFEKGRINYNGKLYDELSFIPADKDTARIEVSRVTIGKDFHWQEEQTQQFSGSWKIVANQENVIGINIIGMEEYLKSVVSSEMSANAPIELLKAHAIIARSWLIRMIEKNEPEMLSGNLHGLIWHEAEEHRYYDVCADDHCQRYQGITRITNPAAVEAVEATQGQVITYLDEVIDARYSKCCGGITEEFSTAWGDKDYPYLISVRDTIGNSQIWRSWIDKNIDKWVGEKPPAWCNVTDPVVIRSIMNDFDQKTTDFYRWTVTYTQEELVDIIRIKTGMDPGEVISLEPLERGPSGRLWKLRINGTLNSWVIGKELEIRRAFSPTHLYSSAFTVETEQDEAGNTTRFIFHGAGWGHGVGLCQIGAANMAAHGYSFQEIIRHYYRKAEVTKIYE